MMRSGGISEGRFSQACKDRDSYHDAMHILAALLAQGDDAVTPDNIREKAEQVVKDKRMSWASTEGVDQAVVAIKAAHGQ